MLRLVVFAAATAALLSSAAIAQVTTPHAPASVRLTQDQWTCLQTRLTNLRRSSSDVVRVPLSPCGQGAGTRGPWATGTNAGQNTSPPPPPPPADTTHAPLWLSKADLDCIERHLPELTSSHQVSQIDLVQCRKH